MRFATKNGVMKISRNAGKRGKLKLHKGTAERGLVTHVRVTLYVYVAHYIKGNASSAATWNVVRSFVRPSVAARDFNKKRITRVR